MTIALAKTACAALVTVAVVLCISGETGRTLLGVVILAGLAAVCHTHPDILGD